MKNHRNELKVQGKQKMNQKKSFLAHAVLASTVFCLAFASSTANAALAPITPANSGEDNTSVPATSGYNFTTDNLEFFITDGTTVGNSGGVSVDASVANTDDVFFFDASSIVSGSIGTTNPIAFVVLDSLLLPSKTVQFQGAIVNAGAIGVSDDGTAIAANGTTLTLNNAAMVLTAPIYVRTNNEDTLNILNAATLNGNIGVTAPGPQGAGFYLVQVGQNGPTTINGNIFATTTQFNGNNVLTLGNGFTITGNVTTTIAGNGILQFAGNGAVTGTIGTGAALTAVRMIGPGSTVNVNSVNTIHGLNFYTGANATSTYIISNNSTITGPIDNTSGTAKIGTVQFAGTGTVTGTVGATNTLNQVNLTGAGNTVTFQGGTYNVGTTNFTKTTSPTSELSFNAPGALNVNTNFTTATNGNGIINFDNGGDTNVNGSVGSANNKIAQVIMDSTNHLYFNGPVFANSVLFDSDGFIGFENMAVLGPITTAAGPNTGFVQFIGSGTVLNAQIGTPASPLKEVEFSAPNTTLLADTIYSQSVGVDTNATLSVVNTSNITSTGGVSVAGKLSLSNNQNLNVNGPFTFQAGSTYITDMGGNLVTTGLINVTGMATTTSPYYLTIVNPGFSPGVTTVIPILTGTSSALTNPLITNPPNLLTTFGTSITGNTLNLTITSKPVETFANQTNTEGVAGALDEIALGAPTTDGLLSIFEQLSLFSNAASLNKALATLAPIVDGAILYESFNTQNRIFGTIGDRMDRMNFWRLHLPNMAKKGVSSGDETYAEADAELGAWAKVFLQHGNQKERQGIDGYQDNTWGVIVGGDTMITEQSLIGASLSWASLDVNNHVSASKTTANSYQATIYGTLDFDCPLFANGSVGVSYNNYVVARNIIFNNIDLFPRAHFHGLQTGAKAEMGYVYTFKSRPSLHAIPVVSMFYSDLNLRGYQETGVGTASQLVQGADFKTLLTGAGVRLADDYALTDYMLLQTQVRAMAFYDLFDDNMQTTSQFAGAGPSFSTVGFTPARASYSLGASAIIFSHYNFNVSADYDFSGKADYTSNTGFFRIRYEFAKGHMF